MTNPAYTPEKKLKVIAQKADPEAVIEKGRRGGFSTTIICVMEDGTERKHRLATTLKRDLIKKLTRLPVDNVKGMELGTNFFTIDVFGYNGI